MLKSEFLLKLYGEQYIPYKKTQKTRVNQTQPNQLSKSSPVPLCSYMLKGKQKEKKKDFFKNVFSPNLIHPYSFLELGEAWREKEGIGP